MSTDKHSAERAVKRIVVKSSEHSVSGRHGQRSGPMVSGCQLGNEAYSRRLPAARQL